MRIIRAADCRRMPWKNGGGETVEIATFPESVGLDAFVWRLSAARVAQDGPFSIFPGIDRTLALLSGEGLDLTMAGSSTRLRLGDSPLSFAGDQPTEAGLLGGAVEDLNVMTRRGLARHRMERVVVQGPLRLDVTRATTLLFCAEGQIDFEGATLQTRDALVLDRTGPEAIMMAGQGLLYATAIEPVRA